MVRVIKRYESRKLYDTEESRYVSLEDIATWVREGQEVKVVDNATSTDVTAQMLTQVILEEGRKGTRFLPSELLHDLVRVGEQALTTGVEQMQQGVDRLVRASVDRLGPVRRVRDEMNNLRSRLEGLESMLSDLERSGQVEEPAEKTSATKKTPKKSERRG
jgi:polyhydroxyalkanoate synthesis repressor PhaR